jgi:hypothetical protein
MGLVQLAAPRTALAQKIDLGLVPNGGDIVFPTPSIHDFEQGWIESSSTFITVEVRPVNRNKAWELRLAAVPPSGGGPGNPFSGLLDFRVADEWIPLQETEQVIFTGLQAADVLVRFRLRLDHRFSIPGTHSTEFLFTATHD